MAHLKKTSLFLYAFTLLLSAASVCAEKSEPINQTCPVMGGDIAKDTKYITTYKGKTIGFCCESCIKEFNSNPEKYFKKIKKEIKKDLKSNQPENSGCSDYGYMADPRSSCYKLKNPKQSCK